jgi:NAD(P)-dependent dehydrogenase (short-subunit alcohol dehydrogenase family)
MTHPFAPVLKDNLLQGKTAFITGGTSGINLGIAKRFAKAGAKVAVLGRNPEKAQKAKDELAALGPAACAVTADVRDPKALEAALVEAKGQVGAFDILVCGAAGNFPAPALGMSPNGFKSVMDIDVLGTFNACRLAYEHMNVPGACVLNISAPQAGHAVPFQAHVCAAKAGVDMITRTLAMEWGPLGVRVNSIWPGAVDGTEGMARLAPTEESRATITQKLPIQRFAQPEDIAEMALFLCSPGAAYVTGSVIAVDGGMSLVGMGNLMG